MATLIAQRDWSSTPLGPRDRWSPTLRTAVDLMLASGHAMQLAWGPQRIILYNDAYAPMLGDRHPHALGLTFQQAWPEIWEEIRPLVDAVFDGQTVKFDEMPLLMTRHGYPEDTWWTFSYSPVRDETGAIVGLLNVTMDVTPRVRAERAERERDDANARLRIHADHLRALIDASSDAVYVMNADWTEMRLLNGRGFVTDVLEPRVNWLEDYLFPEDRETVSEAIRNAVANKTVFELEHRVRRADGSEGWTFSRAVPVFDATNEITEWFGMASDVTKRREVERARDRAEVSAGERASWLLGQRDAFQAALNGEPLAVCMGMLVRTVERRHQGRARCGFYMTDESGLSLSHLTGMPEPFAAQVNGFPVGPDSVACGLAAYRRKRVIVRDVREEGHWRRWLPLAELHQIRAVWSFPVETSSGKVVGTFSLYFRVPCEPDPLDLELAASLADAAAIIISRVHEGEQRARAQLALREADDRLQTLIAGIPQLVWRAEGVGRWTWASPQWTRHTGQSMEASKDWGWLAMLHPDDREVAKQVWHDAQSRDGFEVEYRVCHRESREYRWFQTRATPVYDATGGIQEWLGTSTDIHDMRELQDRQHVLLGELQHRTRNLMSVIHATSNLTYKGSVGLEDFKTRLDDRLGALTRVQALLSRLDERERVTFDELIATEMDAVHADASRITLDGPDGVRLRSSTLQTLAMALHELTTNAVKYGALSQPAAHLAIRWALEPDHPDGKRWLHVDWRETGVAMPAPGALPKGGGQGRLLIERALPYQLGAKTSYEMTADGVHCTISLPVSHSVGEDMDVQVP